MAGTLGVELVSVYDVEEQTLGEETLDPERHHIHHIAAPAPIARMRSGTASDELGGHELRPSKRMGVRVTATYRISG